MEHIVELIKALSLHAFFLLYVRKEDLPAFLISSHLLQELRTIHLNHDPCIRATDHCGAGRAIEEYVIVTKDLPLPEQRKLENLHVSLEPAQHYFALFLLTIDLCLSHHFKWTVKTAVLVVLSTLLLPEHLPAGFSYLVRIVGIVVEGEILLLDLELTLPNDVNLVRNIALLVDYLILNEGLRLQNEVDDFEKLRLGPNTEKGEVLQNVHLLQL